VSKVVRWGLIGAGDIVRKRVAAALRDAPSSEIVAVSRARFELAEEFARAFGVPRWYRDWRELIADPDVDAVYIATPVHIHAEQAIAAADAGKHVLCEKPMAMNVAECDRIIAACKANGVALSVAYYRHFYPVIARMKAILASDDIGDPVLAQVDAFEQFQPSSEHPRAWLLRKAESGGGPMMDFGCHRLEVLLHLFGPVQRVTSLVSSAVLGREVEDTAIASLRFERGPCATVTVTHAAEEARDTVNVFATRGSLHINSLNGGELIVASNGSRRTESHPPAANIHQPLVQDFVDAVLSGRAPGVGGDIGRTVAQLEEEIYSEDVRPRSAT
jgi:predicted dehydrogenase